MLRLTFTPEQIDALNFERYHHPHPRVQRRMEALWLKSQGLPHAQIAQLAGVTPNTLRAYFRLLQQGGVAALKRFEFYRPESALMAHRSSVETYFCENPPAAAPAAAAAIERLTGVRRSPTQVRQFLKRIGMARRKVGLLPAGVDPAAQRAYREKNSSRP
jgi:transposase